MKKQSIVHNHVPTFTLCSHSKIRLFEAVWLATWWTSPPSCFKQIQTTKKNILVFLDAQQCWPLCTFGNISAVNAGLQIFSETWSIRDHNSNVYSPSTRDLYNCFLQSSYIRKHTRVTDNISNGCIPFTFPQPCYRPFSQETFWQVLIISLMMAVFHSGRDTVNVSSVSHCY